MILLGLILAVFYCAAYMPMNRAHRLELHGLPTDLENPQQAQRHATERRSYEQLHGRG